MKKIVYIAAPLSADTPEGIAANRARAARWVAWAALSGVVPQATWIVLTGELTEEHRELGLELDCALVRRCDELWLVGGRVSSGMQIEADHAKEHSIPVVDLTALGEEPPVLGAEDMDILLAPPTSKGCAHESVSVEFDDAAAAGLSANEIRKRWPRFWGNCPDCGCSLIKYASAAHYVMGDW